MKQPPYIKLLFLSLVVLMIAGCAGQAMRSGYGTFTPEGFQSGHYTPKVDHFMVVLDASSSMDASTPDGHSRFAQAKAVVERMNETLPDLEIGAALRTFGHSPRLSRSLSSLFYGPADYDRAGFRQALRKLVPAGGTTPMSTALYAASGDLSGTSGPLAVIVVSDGVATGKNPVRAAADLKAALGERLCIYTVQIGDDDAGKTTLEAIADAGQCGFAVNGADILDAGDMAGFVEKVFLTPRKDSDGDGVYDDRDKCPGTPPGTTVDADGCPPKMAATTVQEPMEKKVTIPAEGRWVVNDVLFDFDKAELKPSASGVLAEVVQALKANPEWRVSLEGHTDSIGAAAYNMGLSVRRANAVKAFLIENGIDAERLSTKGFGLTRPVDSNETAAGRARNRRVEIRPIR